MRLDELLNKFQQLDDGDLELTPEDSDTLLDEFRLKIYSISLGKKNLESLVEHHKNLAFEHIEARKSIEKKIESLEKWVLLCLKKSGMPKAMGISSQISIGKSKRVVMAFDESEIDYATLDKYAAAIKTSYKWDKMYIKENIDDLGEIAKIEETEHLKFGIKK